MFTPARRVGGDGPLTAVGEVSSRWWRRLSQTPTLWIVFISPFDTCYSGTWTNASRVTLLGRMVARAAGVDAGMAKIPVAVESQPATTFGICRRQTPFDRLFLALDGF